VSEAELIIVRSLVDSDMGLFAAHQKGITSKQRAMALTERAAEELLDPAIFQNKRGEFDCICIFGEAASRERRLINKADKNWRLGGRQLEGEVFATLDSKDFALLRSVRHNDGSTPVLLTFVGRRSQRLVQAGLVATLSSALRQSVAIFADNSPEFGTLAKLFPPVPAHVAVRGALHQPALL
jgi:hypothetical protein